MKKSTVILALFILFNQSSFCQYIETFSTPNKGVLAGPCGATAASCSSNDFTGVNWSINGNLSGFDNDDIMATNASGVLFVGGDIDEEMCFESPLINISAVVGGADISVDLGWIHHDNAEYIDVEYMLNGNGTWIQIPNQFGGGSHTVDFPGSGNTGSGTVTQGGLAGNSLSVRVCVDSNTASSGESTTIDNVSVPNAGSVLPVKWSDIRAAISNKGNTINWSTVNEINNESFEIQKRNDDDLEFHTIGEVDGQENSYRTKEYSFLDDNINGGTVYYRIKQNDLDGLFSYSDIVSLKNEKSSSFTSYPNPFKNRVTLSFENEENQQFDIHIFDSFGRLVLVKNVKDTNNITIETHDFNKGIYYVKSRFDTHILVKE